MSFIKPDGESVNRSFTLDKALDDELLQEAQRRGVSVSNLLSQLVNKYLNFHRYNHNRNYINMGNNTLKNLMLHIDEEKLYECGYTMGGENPISRVFRAGLKPGKESLMIYLKTLDFYANWFTCEEKTIGGIKYIYIDHNHGLLWSRFLEGYFNGIFDKLDMIAEITRHGKCFLIHLK
ncbi:MAG: CopG family transcriptional regulator [archaeon]